MECKNCKRKTHYCSSCDDEPCLSMGYCSDKCWYTSEEYNTVKKRFTDFYLSLEENQRKIFRYTHCEMDSDYEREVEKWMNMADAGKELDPVVPEKEKEKPMIELPPNFD